jgi:hypothetical protein
MLKKIMRSILGKESGSSQAPAISRRQHHRYTVEHTTLFKLNFTSGHSYNIHNLSYGGFGITSDDITADEMTFLISQTQAELSVNGHTVAAGITFLYSHNDELGFEFNHDDMKVLEFLREYIEFLRLGSSLSEIKQEGPTDHKILRGDKSTDLVVKLDSNKKIYEACIGFSDGEQQIEINLMEFTDEQSTSKGLLDIQTKSMCILSGIEDKDLCRSLLPLLNKTPSRNAKGA